MAKRKAPHTPSRKQNKRLRDPKTGRFLPSNVREANHGVTSPSPEPGTQNSDNTVDSRRTQLTPLEHAQRAEPPQTPERESSLIKDTPSPEPEVNPEQGALIWNLITPVRSFWDAVRRSAQDQSVDTATSSTENDIDGIMKNVTNSVNYHIQSRGIENQGYLSSSPRAPCRDARAMVPVSPRDEQEQQLMMWATVQQAVETVALRVWQPDPVESYLTNLKMVRDQFSLAWQASEQSGVAPTLFHLEPWQSTIPDWRDSFYTNGEERYAVSDVMAVLETWFEEMYPDEGPTEEDPTQTKPVPRTPLGDITSSFHGGLAITSPYIDQSHLRPARNSLEELAERFGDNGLPAPITDADRRRAQYTALVPDLTHGNRSIEFPATGETFTNLNDHREPTPPEVPDIWRDDDCLTPPPGVDEPEYDTGSQNSDKENDPRLELQRVEDERNERAAEEAIQASIEQAEADEEARVAREQSPSEWRRRRWEEQYGPAI